MTEDWASSANAASRPVYNANPGRAYDAGRPSGGRPPGIPFRQGLVAMAKAAKVKVVAVKAATAAMAMAAMEEETVAAMAATGAGAPSVKSARTGDTRRETAAATMTLTIAPGTPRRPPPLTSHLTGSWTPVRRTI